MLGGSVLNRPEIGEGQAGVARRWSLKAAVSAHRHLWHQRARLDGTCRAVLRGQAGQASAAPADGSVAISPQRPPEGSAPSGHPSQGSESGERGPALTARLYHRAHNSSERKPARQHLPGEEGGAREANQVTQSHRLRGQMG